MAQVFIAHSNKDDWLINQIASNLKLIPVKPYLAKLEDPTSYPLPEKINNAIKLSAAMFVFLTPNVANNENTRDIVNWEISAAYTMKKPIYVFREEGVEVPLIWNYITTYLSYSPVKKDSLKKVTEKVQKLAAIFKENEDKAQTALSMVLFTLGVGVGLWFLDSLGKK